MDNNTGTFDGAGADTSVNLDASFFGSGSQTTPEATNAAPASLRLDVDGQPMEFTPEMVRELYGFKTKQSSSLTTAEKALKEREAQYKEAYEILQKRIEEMDAPSGDEVIDENKHVVIQGKAYRLGDILNHLLTNLSTSSKTATELQEKIVRKDVQTEIQSFAEEKNLNEADITKVLNKAVELNNPDLNYAYYMVFGESKIKNETMRSLSRLTPSGSVPEPSSAEEAMEEIINTGNRRFI